MDVCWLRTRKAVKATQARQGCAVAVENHNNSPYMPKEKSQSEQAQRELRDKSGWEILSPSQMGIVCFRFDLGFDPPRDQVIGTP